MADEAFGEYELSQRSRKEIVVDHKLSHHEGVNRVRNFLKILCRSAASCLSGARVLHRGEAFERLIVAMVRVATPDSVGGRAGAPRARSRAGPSTTTRALVFFFAFFN